ncbi:MAG: hypothetical protein NXI16_09230 [Alphaproteobacteria bacterium]|nr:hypothetical protein [Alphaproteobacteria bacterium]
MSLRLAAMVIVASMIVAACSPEELVERYTKVRQAGNVLAAAICALPVDHAVRKRVREDLVAIGYDPSRVCEEGLDGLRYLPGKPA